MSTDAATFWDGIHAARPTPTDPRPNPRLTETVADLPPGTALDLGCGNGGDALWLTRRGWQVTATDISAVALERLAALDPSITTHHHDLRDSFPPGTFDLINAHYLHTPFELNRAAVLHAAAQALRPGGLLLVVDHGSAAPWSWTQDTTYPDSRPTLADLDPTTWTTLRADSPTRTATGPNGQTAEVTDHVLLIRRR